MKNPVYYLFVLFFMPFFSFTQSLDFLRVETYTNENLSITVPANEVYLLKSVTKASIHYNTPTINILKDGIQQEFAFNDPKWDGNSSKFNNKFQTPNLYLSPNTNITSLSENAIFTFFVYSYPEDFEIITVFDTNLDYTVETNEIFHLVQALERYNLSPDEIYRTLEFTNTELGISYSAYWGTSYNNPTPVQLNQYFSEGWNIKPLNFINNIYVAFIYNENTLGLDQNNFFSYQNDLQAYPNPTNSKLTLNSDKNYEIEVYDMAGKKVMEAVGNTLDMSTLSNATYIIKAFDKATKETSSYKVVKN